MIIIIKEILFYVKDLKIYKINNYKSYDHFINKAIQLCELIIISNYNLEYKNILLKENSFVYLSNQNIYFADKNYIN